MNLPAASGFLISALVLLVSVPAARIVLWKSRSSSDRAATAAGKRAVPSGLMPSHVESQVAWAIDAVAAFSTLIGPIASGALVLPSIGAAGATVANVAGFVVSLFLFTYVLLIPDVVKWGKRYRGWFSPVVIWGVAANVIVGGAVLVGSGIWG